MIVVERYHITTVRSPVRFPAFYLKSRTQACHLATKSEVHICVFTIVVIAADLLQNTSIGFEKGPGRVYRRTLSDTIGT
jgi:hypothetical protein